jgi:hypothetical protein
MPFGLVQCNKGSDLYIPGAILEAKFHGKKAKEAGIQKE